MTLVFELLAAALLLFLVGAAATGRLGGLVEATPDRADVSLPPGRLHPDDANDARFTMAFRGYRMDEVDATVDRFVAELRARDEELADKDTELARLAKQVEAASVAPTPQSWTPAAPQSELDRPVADAAVEGPIQGSPPTTPNHEE